MTKTLNTARPPAQSDEINLPETLQLTASAVIDLTAAGDQDANGVLPKT